MTTVPPGAPAEPGDSIAGFASDLRALRLAADSPTLLSLQHTTGVSKTALSEAFAGKRLPSARTVDRVVRACGEDPAPWVARRDVLAGRAPGAGGSAADASVATGAGAPRGSRKRTVLLVAAAFVAGLVIAGGVNLLITAKLVDSARAEAAEQTRQEILASPASEHAQINVHNGVDPALTPCVNDAKVATAQPRTDNTLLEIIWSNKCYAGWARITRYDEKVSGNSMTVSIYPETAATGPDRQTATEPNVQSAYTTLVVRPTPQTRLCAVGAITLEGESIDLGEPLCT